MYLVPIAADAESQIPSAEIISEHRETSTAGEPTVAAALAGMNPTDSLLAVCRGNDAAVCLSMIRRILQADPAVLSSGSLACFAAESIPEDLRVSLPTTMLPFCRRSGGELLLASRQFLSTLDPAGLLAESLWHHLAGAVTLPWGPKPESLPGAVAKRPALPLRTVFAVARRLARQQRQDEYGTDCLMAGLLLLHDYPEESHQLSQRNEGFGSPRTADYWHGIMHRREPDAGNAGYWFRRVGSHPVLQEVGGALERWMMDLQLEPAVVQRAAALIGRNGTVDPFRVIELSTEVLRTAEPAADLTLRVVQNLEILALLRFGLRQSESE